MPITEYYIGPAGALNIIPAPFLGAQINRSHMANSSQLASGKWVTNRRLDSKASFQLTWNKLTPTQMDILKILWSGALGVKNLGFVSPIYRNYMPENHSVAGGMAKAVPDGWTDSTATAPSFYTAGAVAPPVLGSSIVQHSALVAASTVTFCNKASSTYGTVDGTRCPFAIANEPTTFSIYARLLNGAATVVPNIGTGNDADAFPSALQAGVGVALSTSAWTRLSVTWNGVSGTMKNFLVPSLTATSSTSTGVLLAAPQFEYDSQANPWMLGHGAPHVSFGDDANINFPFIGYRDISLTLLETVI